MLSNFELSSAVFFEVQFAVARFLWNIVIMIKAHNRLTDDTATSTLPLSLKAFHLPEINVDLRRL